MDLHRHATPTLPVFVGLLLLIVATPAVQAFEGIRRKDISIGGKTLVIPNHIALVYERKGNPYHDDQARRKVGEARLAHCDATSASQIADVHRALETLQCEVKHVDPLDLQRLAPRLKRNGYVVLNKSRGRPGENGIIRGMNRKAFVPNTCDATGLLYVGSNAKIATAARDKFGTIVTLGQAGFRVPKAVLIHPDGTVKVSPDGRPGYPVIPKPVAEAGSLGVTAKSIFGSSRGLEEKIRELHEAFDQPVILEEYIEGPELKVAVVGNGRDARGLGCVSVMRAHTCEPIIGSVQSREDVLHDGVYYERLAGKLATKACRLAEQVHDVFGAWDYSRADWRVDLNTGDLVAMDYSTTADIAEGDSFPTAAMGTLSSYTHVLAEIIAATLIRGQPGAGI